MAVVVAAAAAADPSDFNGTVCAGTPCNVSLGGDASWGGTTVADIPALFPAPGSVPAAPILRLTWDELVFVVVSCIVIFVIVTGNTLVIVAVMTTRRLRTITNCFVLSLAVADWMVGVFVVPPALAKHLMGTWELGWVLCDLWVSLDVLLCTASILSLCAISVDRYLAVTQPLNYSRRRRSKRLALVMILVVWILAAAITCPPIFGWYEAGRHENKTCEYNTNRGYVVFSALGSFFVPLFVMIYVYAKISWVVARRHDSLTAWDNRRPSRRLRDVALDTRQPPVSGYTTCSRSLHGSSGSGSAGNGTANTGAANTTISNNNCTVGSHANAAEHDSLRPPAARMASSTNVSAPASSAARVASFRRSESKTAKTLWVLVGGFVACWLPFFVVYLLTPFVSEGAVSSNLKVGFTWLGWINSAVNPFIYAFYSPDFRVAFWRLTFRHCTPRK